MQIHDLVSIVIPVYNSSKYIEETIKSIENQTYEKYEAIFVDDYSNDNSIDIIEKYKNQNSKIKLIKLKKHEGVSEARNAGIREAKGEYLTFLDSDDIWLENKLERQLDYIKKNNHAFVYCNFKYISDDGTLISKEIKTGKKTDYSKGLKNIRILTITAMIDLKQIPKELCYMPNVMNEDVATWWQILKNGYTAYGQDEVLAYYRKTKNSRSSNKYVTAYYRWKLYREYEKLGIVKSIYCFGNYALNAIIKRTGRMEKNQNNNIQIAVSTMNLQNDIEVNNLLKKMNIKSDYLIINQTLNTKVDIKNENVITKYETGISKSRNIAINNTKQDIILLADDDVIYNDGYEKIVTNAWEKYSNADIICFYVESKNKQRKIKK